MKTVHQPPRHVVWGQPTGQLRPLNSGERTRATEVAARLEQVASCAEDVIQTLKTGLNAYRELISTPL